MTSSRLNTRSRSLITVLGALSLLSIQCRGQENSGTPIPAAQPSPAQLEAPTTSPQLSVISAIAPELRKDDTTPSSPSTNVPPPALPADQSQPTFGGIRHQTGRTMGLMTGGILLATLLAFGAIFVANRMQIARDIAAELASAEGVATGARAVLGVISNVAFGVLSDDVVIDISKVRQILTWEGGRWISCFGKRFLEVLFIFAVVWKTRNWHIRLRHRKCGWTYLHVTLIPLIYLPSPEILFFLPKIVLKILSTHSQFQQFLMQVSKVLKHVRIQNGSLKISEFVSF